jgi:tetratricopeptide (TPR) repeat protein
MIAPPKTRSLRAPRALLCASLLIGLVGAARAQDALPNRADALFEEGKNRLAAGDLDAACPLLVQSYQLDPATGALLASALCHERAGRLATAHAEYLEAAARARAQGDAQRERAASARADELAPRRSILTLLAPQPPIEHLAVELDGEPLDPGSLGAELPLDGGPHVVQAHAPGHRALRAEIDLQPSGDAQQLVLQLTPEAPPPPPIAASVETASSDFDPAPRREPSLSVSQWLGVGTAGLGALGVGVGTFFAIRGDERSNCGSCPGAFAADDSDRAALYFVVAGTLIATGAAIYLIESESGGGSASRATPRLAASAWALPRAGGATLTGRF